MSITAIVRALVTAGASPEMILAAVEAAEGVQCEALARRRASDAERQRRKRERHVTSRDVTVTDRDPPPIDGRALTTTLEPTHNPLPKTPLKGGKKGSRLEGDWQPSTEDRQAAATIGFTVQQADAEFEKFRDYWLAKPGQAGVKLDWAATLRNWLRTSAERRGITPKPLAIVATGPPPRRLTPEEVEEQCRAYGIP